MEMYENNAEKVCILTLLFAGKVCHLRTPLICFMFFFLQAFGENLANEIINPVRMSFSPPMVSTAF